MFDAAASVTWWRGRCSRFLLTIMLRLQATCMSLVTLSVAALIIFAAGHTLALPPGICRSYSRQPCRHQSVLRPHARAVAIMSDQDDAMDHSLDETSEMPSLILPFLYLGGKVVARARETLDTLNVRSIINCTPSRDTDPRAGVPNFYQAEKDRFTYRRVPVFDSKGANLSQYFNSCVDFIEKSKHHGAVLVHCVQGVSRSTSIVLAYLMKSKGVPLDKALEFVRKRRPVARPNASFMKQLQDFEHRCMAERRQKATGVRTVSGPARPTAAVPAPASGPPESSAAAVAAAVAAAIAAAEAEDAAAAAAAEAEATEEEAAAPASQELAVAETAAAAVAEPPSRLGGGSSSSSSSSSRKRSAADTGPAADAAGGKESSRGRSGEAAETAQASSVVVAEGQRGVSEGDAAAAEGVDGAPPSAKVARRPTKAKAGAEEE